MPKIVLWSAGPGWHCIITMPCPKERKEYIENVQIPQLKRIGGIYD